MDWKLHSFYEFFWLTNLEILENISDFSVWTSIQEQVKGSINKLLENNPKVKNEIEKKILRVDREGLWKKLISFWAKETYRWNIEDNRFDFDSNELKDSWLMLRLRNLDNWVNIVTLKKRKDVDLLKKTASKDLELEGVVYSDEVNDLLEHIHSLWLKVLEDKNYKKFRVTYELDWVHFDFDEYELLDYVLLEIESEKEEDIDFWIEKLWITHLETVNYWFRKLKQRETNIY